MSFNNVLIKNLIKLSFKFSISFGILYFIFLNIEFEEIVINLINVPFMFIAVGLILPFILLQIMIFKWRIFINTFSNQPYLRLFKIYWASDFLSLFSFGSIGGETFKMLSFPNNKKNAIIASLYDKGLSFLWYIIFALSLYIFYTFTEFSLTSCAILASAFFIILVIFIIIILNILKKEIVFNNKFAFIIHIYSSIQDKGILIHALLSFIFILTTYFAYSIILFALDIPFQIELLFYIPILIILVTLPISVQGLGVRELVLTTYALEHSINLEPVLTASMLIFGFSLVERLLGVIPFLILKPAK